MPAKKCWHGRISVHKNNTPTAWVRAGVLSIKQVFWLTLQTAHTLPSQFPSDWLSSSCAASALTAAVPFGTLTRFPILCLNRYANRQHLTLGYYHWLNPLSSRAGLLFLLFSVKKLRGFCFLSAFSETIKTTCSSLSNLWYKKIKYCQKRLDKLQKRVIIALAFSGIV